MLKLKGNANTTVMNVKNTVRQSLSRENYFIQFLKQGQKMLAAVAKFKAEIHNSEVVSKCNLHSVC